MNKLIVILGVVVIEIAMAITLVPWTDHSHIETTDFVNFYAAATIVHAGDGARLYRPETQDQVLKSILGRKVPEYFLHPPFEAGALAPLSYLPIERAYVLWTLLNFSLLGLLPLVFAESATFVAQRHYLGLVGFVFPPVLAALTLGQDSIIILFAMSCAYLLYSKYRDFWGGVVLSLATVKFQYVLIVVVLLAFSRKWRLVAGFAAGCAFLMLISLAVTGPAGIVEYVKFVHSFDLHGGYGSLRPELMVNWRGFFSGTGWVRDVRLYSIIGSVILITGGILCSRSATTVESRELTFALYVAIAVAASPYAFFEDATILLLPIFLAVDWVLSRGRRGLAGKLIVFSCVSLFLCPVILMIVGGHYWWNSRIYLMFPVIVLFIVALMAELCLRRMPDLLIASA